MGYTNCMAGLAAAVLLPFLVAGCNSSSGGDSGSGDGEGGAVDVQSAVTLGSRAHWLGFAPWPLEGPGGGAAIGHMLEEPLRWFFLRDFLAQGVDPVPEGGPSAPDCAAGSQEFDHTDAALTAVYDRCRIEAGAPPALLGVVPGGGDQMWDGRQAFERNLDDPDWDRVYVIENDAMTYSLRGGEQPFRSVDSSMTLYYRDVNDMVIKGEAILGHKDAEGGYSLVYDYGYVDTRWQPDGVEGAKSVGRFNVTVSATPASTMDLEGQRAGLFGDWAVETREPVRYQETITEELHPYAGTVHLTAEDGNSIVFQFEPSGMFMDGSFITWDKFDQLNEDPELRKTFLENNFPGTW